MKTRLSFFAPAAVPDITALEQRYSLLIAQVMALIAANDFTQTLSVSRDIARAARALMAGKAQLAAAELKRKMLLNTAWRSRVIADLGGYRKLHLWQRARRRAAMRAALLSLSSPVENGGTRRQTALPPAELTRRAGIRDRARACAHPLIFKDATPGRRRHPKFRRPADAARLPVRRSPYVRRQNRAPPARAREI